jgi:hypothetical protein
VLRSCSQADVDAALADGSAVDVEYAGAPALSLTELAEAEELLADGLLALAAENRLAVVAGPDPDARRRALDQALGTVPAVVLDDAHRLGTEDVLAAVEDLQEDAVLALCLDPALPLGPVPGAVALDLASTGSCPVLKADGPPPRSSLERARAEVAAGRWFAPDPSDRSVVEVRVGSPEEAVLRVVQLVSTSIPRAFGNGPADVVVLLGPGSVEPGAVLAAFEGTAPRVQLLDASAAEVSEPAAVVVLGPVGPGLTRALVYAGLHAGARHVSVVHGSEPGALGQALSAGPDRPRRTRLAALLTA